MWAASLASTFMSGMVSSRSLGVRFSKAPSGLAMAMDWKARRTATASRTAQAAFFPTTLLL